MNKLRIAGCLLAGSLSWAGLAADPAQPTAGTERSTMAAKISALLRATLPKYEAKPAVEEPTVVEVDDEVVELPKLIVTGDRPPIFSEREVQTKTGMAELVRKRYPGASFKGQPEQCPNYARLMYADDERRLRLDDLKTTAAVFHKVSAQAGDDDLESDVAATFLRRHDWATESLDRSANNNRR